MSQRIVSISPSALNNSNCFRKYKYAQIDRWRSRYRPSYFDKGTLLHRYLEVYYTARFNSQHSDLAMSEALDTVAPEIVAMQLSLEEAGECAEIFKEYVKVYRDEPWIPIEMESVFSFIIYEDDEIQILAEGRKDLVVDVPHSTGVMRAVVDHKSRGRTQKVNSLNYAYPIYALASGVNTVIDNELGTQKSTPKAGRFKRTALSYSPARLEEVRENIAYKVKSIMHHADMDVFPPNFSACGFCQFKKVCDAEPELREFILNTEFEVVQHDVMNEEGEETPSE